MPPRTAIGTVYERPGSGYYYIGGLGASSAECCTQDQIMASVSRGEMPLCPCTETTSAVSPAAESSSFWTENRKKVALAGAGLLALYIFTRK